MTHRFLNWKFLCQSLLAYIDLLIKCIFSSPESVIKWFEQRDRAVDSRGVAEYLRALVVTNAISEYLPDEDSGKASSLPTLVIILSIMFFISCFSIFSLCNQILTAAFSLVEVEGFPVHLVWHLFVNNNIGLFKSLFCFISIRII